MRYNLGELRLHADLHSMLASWLRRARAGRADPERLRSQVIAAMQAEGRADGGDLLGELRRDAGDDGWVFELSEALRAHADLQLTHCEREVGRDGYVGIAVTKRTHAVDVRVGDTLCAGLAAVRTPDGTVEVLPRIYRKLCTNGAIIDVGRGSDLLEQCGSIAQAVDLALAPSSTGAAFEVLREAAGARVDDPIQLLREAHVTASANAIWSLREEDDRTVFGVVNALTAFARRLPRFDRRLEFERGAARVLAAAGLWPRRGTVDAAGSTATGDNRARSIAGSR